MYNINEKRKKNKIFMLYINGFEVNELEIIGLEMIGLEMIELEVIGLEVIALEMFGLEMIELEKIGFQVKYSIVKKMHVCCYFTVSTHKNYSKKSF